MNQLMVDVLGILPADGAPVRQRDLVPMLEVKTQSKVFAKSLEEALGCLQATGLVFRQKGPGRPVRLLVDGEGNDGLVMPPAYGNVSEATLMPYLNTYLRGAFRSEIGATGEDIHIVQDTSYKGPATGLWRRPDFVVVACSRLQLFRGYCVDVHSFELKNEQGGSPMAVHEALAQTRSTHYGHLVWYLPDGSHLAKARLAEVEAECIRHGVGLIRMRDMSGMAEILVDPLRKSPTMNEVDAFLVERLSAENCEALMQVAQAS